MEQKNGLRGYVQKKGLEGKGIHSFFFIKPKKCTDVNDLADKLIGIDGMEEVNVTQGDIGYMVKAKFDDNTYEPMKKQIAEIAGKKYGVCVSALELKKVE